MAINNKGKIVFITGAAGGAGFGQAQYFGRHGCKLYLVDVRQEGLDVALKSLTDEGIEAHGKQLDLMDREAFARVVEDVEAVYGEPPHLLFNTAGVVSFGPTEASTFEDFDWMMGVNYGGVVNGMVLFIPRMIKAGRPGHVLTTASLGGFVGADGPAIYSSAKAAVINLMEGYRMALAKYDIGVTVLCPANIRSNIALAGDVRPAHLKRSGYVVTEETKQSLGTLFAQGMDPLQLADHARQAIDDNELYCVPYPEAKGLLEGHFADVLKVVPSIESDLEGFNQRNEAVMRWVAERGDLFDRKSDEAPI